ncbi:PLC-like phosphodiesterase [Sistotremastrum suecicum HHB10207 ss-3]|uniref:PLC-like phosphodiesterase n=1 Tax=Sistotremastrum suecicum HHB10207 ss-3 TaxID=1314776 RepID=A0A165XLJ4_9AGAM|nr:PLC-like phosphodiesterase [Sistotremastrum suecicum HHB10207 ss-3]
MQLFSFISFLALPFQFIFNFNELGGFSAPLCNGRAELCNRSYGNITFVGAHDSYANDDINPAATQSISIAKQLELGVRLLQAQSHMFEGQLHFCHTSCLLYNGGTVLNYLKTVKTWLDANPREVLTILFTNPEGVSYINVWLPIFEQAGIDHYAYVPPNPQMRKSDWPTLEALIDANKRLVTFMDYPNKATPNDTVPFMIFEFPNIWETPFDTTNAKFPCSVDRIVNGSLSIQDHMYMINHYLDVKIGTILIPDRLSAPKTNSQASILSEAYGCLQFSGGTAPNFVLVDWVDKGVPIQTANFLNGL